MDQTIEYMASQSDLTPLVERWLELDRQPLHDPLINAARWLHNARETAPWRARLLQKLDTFVQDEKQPLALRARIVTALCLGGNAGVDALFRQMLASPQPAARHLAALGIGLSQDSKAVDLLTPLLNDPFPVVYKAASLALVAIGTRPALEAVADCLLQGSEDLRRSAAQALANHVEEGHPTLKEGATLEDLLVRKAVVAGLQRLRAPWAVAMIEKIRLEDSEWVVKNAATQALEELARPYEYIPHRLPELTETPWLIAFAGEKGIGVAPGKAAVDLLLLALKEGKEEQRLAALDTIRLNGDSRGVLAVYQVYYTAQGDLFEAAYQTLWHLSASGVLLPSPAQFGLSHPG
jgi:HEAT repeat protein